MLDIGEVFDRITEMVGSAGAEDALNADLSSAGFQNLLDNVDLDPAMLENLPIGDLQQHLDGLGIDPASIAEGDIQDIVTQFATDSIKGE